MATTHDVAAVLCWFEIGIYFDVSVICVRVAWFYRRHLKMSLYLLHLEPVTCNLSIIKDEQCKHKCIKTFSNPSSHYSVLQYSGESFISEAAIITLQRGTVVKRQNWLEPPGAHAVRRDKPKHFFHKYNLCTIICQNIMNMFFSGSISYISKLLFSSCVPAGSQPAQTLWVKEASKASWHMNHFHWNHWDAILQNYFVV